MVALTVVLSGIGFALLHFNFIGYGSTFFVLVPLCIGFFLGQRPTCGVGFIFGTITGVVIFLYLLVTSQLEGLFCVVTLSPLLFILVFLGSWLGYWLRQGISKPEKHSARLTFVPLLVLLSAGTLEHYFTEKFDYNEVESKIYLPYSPEVVFDHIKSVDTLDTEKPFLLHLGLSVPQKCILESEAVGASRICYFKEGTIDEKVVEIKRGEILKMEVRRYRLPGRKWLKFRDAVYLFQPKANGTELTRLTTYQTELKPRFYWKFWEEKAIEAEHTYVLNDLKKRLGNH